jgi:hypothetical protein
MLYSGISLSQLLTKTKSFLPSFTLSFLATKLLEGGWFSSACFLPRPLHPLAFLFQTVSKCILNEHALVVHINGVNWWFNTCAVIWFVFPKLHWSGSGQGQEMIS